MVKIRKLLEDFAPYEWEPSSEEIAAKTGLDVKQIHRLDTNASPYVPREWLSKLASKLLELEVNQYPDTSYSRLRRDLSKYASVGADRIVPTNGADEALDLAVKTFVDPGSEAIVSTPTYSYYKITVEIHNGRVAQIPRKADFSDDIEGLLKAASEKTRLIILCSPNNPTGNTASREGVIRLLEESGCAVLIDEAYYEFCGKTSVDLTARYDNLIVMRTFSKAFSLAGARVGYMIASKNTVGFLNKVRPPNSLGTISLALAQIALEDLDTVKARVKETLQERERCISFLKGLRGVEVYPSEANFVLVRFTEVDASQAYQRLLNRGFVVRNLSEVPRLKGCLRFTIGLPSQNSALLETFVEITSIA